MLRFRSGLRVRGIGSMCLSRMKVLRVDGFLGFEMMELKRNQLRLTKTLLRLKKTRIVTKTWRRSKCRSELRLIIRKLNTQSLGPSSHPSASAHDPDLREHQRTNAIQALSKRYSQRGNAGPTTNKLVRKPKSKPLFHPEPEEVDVEVLGDDLEDPELVAALQASVESQEEQEALDLQRAMELSAAERSNTSHSHSGTSSAGASSSRVTLDNSIAPSTPAKATPRNISSHRNVSDDEDLYASPTRLETALSIGGASPVKKPKPTFRATSGSFSHSFGKPSHLLQDTPHTMSTSNTDTTPKRVSFNESRPSAPISSPTSPKKPSPLVARVEREKTPSILVEVSSDEDDLEEILYLLLQCQSLRISSYWSL